MIVVQFRVDIASQLVCRLYEGNIIINQDDRLVQVISEGKFESGVCQVNDLYYKCDIESIKGMD